jgi:hypothetical protein
MRPPLDHHCCFLSLDVSTPRLPTHPTLTSTRSRPGGLLSAAAQAGGEVAVSQALECRRFSHRCFFHRWPALPSTEGERASLIDRCSLHWMRGQGRFIVLQCACPRVITAVSTPRLPTLITTRSRPGRLLSAEAQAGGGVAVFLPLEYR